jgi:demethylmenaquinone methyltransferase/2-methoxy-6-polyprenyl-1,4-benzoquinol methylase
MTLGLHKRWKKSAVALSKPEKGNFVLDAASGTGDFALEFKKITGDSGKVAAVDFSNEMLDVLRIKSEKMKLDIECYRQDVSAMDFPDNYFDIASIGYGVRNFDNPVKVLSEIARVLKNNGKIVILETGQPDKIFRIFYKLYAFLFIKPLGKIFSKDKNAYNYLLDTASEFPFAEEFLGLMKKTELFSECKFRKLLFGVSYIYTGSINKNL